VSIQVESWVELALLENETSKLRAEKMNRCYPIKDRSCQEENQTKTMDKRGVTEHKVFVGLKD
jgi:hypothetical protein